MDDVEEEHSHHFFSEIDLTTGNLFKKMLLFALPLIITSLLQIIYTSCDLIVVSNFGGGDNSMGSIGSCNSIINLLIGSFIGISSGVNVAIGNSRGRKDKEGAERAMYSSILLAVVIGVPLAIFGYFMSSNLLYFMKTDPQLFDQAVVYLKIYFIGVPFSLIYNFGANVLRAIGDSIKPFITLLLTFVVNITLNFAFVCGAHLDVLGVAIGTILSQFVSAVMIMFFLIKNKNGFIKFNLKDCKFYKNETRRVLKYGIPSMFQSLFFSIPNTIIQQQANTFGTAAVNGNAAASNIENYLYVVLNSFSVAVLAMTSQNYGAKNKENLKKVLLYSLVTITILGAVLGGLMIILRQPLLGILINNEEEMQYAEERYVVIIGTYTLCGLMDSLSAYLRGLKYTISPTLITFASATLFRIVFIFTFFTFIPSMHTLGWLYACFPLSWVLACLAYGITVPFGMKKRFKHIDERLKEMALQQQNQINTQL